MPQFIHQGQQKKKYVKQMFNDISKTYDLINLLSSMGIDRYWRKKLIDKVKLTSSQSLLDVATGTGDVAFGFLKRCSSDLENIFVVCVDASSIPNIKSIVHTTSLHNLISQQS